MNKQKINEIINRIRITKMKIKDTIGINTNMIKVIVLGITGSGKSSLTSCLANEEVLIKEGKLKAILTGPGIGSGFTSVTKEPSVFIDYSSNIMYIDCPGFEDTEQYMQEIINSFVIDYLFEMSIYSKFKILLVISEQEFEACRGQSIKRTLERMNKMFPKPGELEKGIGLVITKGDIEYTAKDYIEIMEENSEDSVKNWCNFFKRNLDRVFVFPQASKKDINKRYDFNDHLRLKKFLFDNFIVNPVHKIALSENATLSMQYLGENLSRYIKDIVRCIFIKITDNYLIDNSYYLLSKWLDWIYDLKDRNIANSYDMNSFLKTYFPRNATYTYYTDCLNDLNIMNNFLIKVLGINYCNSTLKEAVSEQVSYAIEEIESLKEKARVCKIIKARKAEFERMLEIRKRQIKEEINNQRNLQIQIDKKRNEIERQKVKIANLRKQIRR